MDDELNSDGTPRTPDRPHCAGLSKSGQPCMRVVLSHEYGGDLYCNSHAPAGSTLLKWDPTRIPLCEGVLADGKSRCTRAVLEHVTVGPGVERGLCRKHLDWWRSHGTLVLPKQPRRKRMPAAVEPLGEDEVVPDEIVEPLPTRNGKPTDLRLALQETATDAYAEIELGLREAIRSARKTTRVACPKCSHAFALQVRDWSNVIRASSELLDRVVAKPSATARDNMEIPVDEAEIAEMSTEMLIKLVARAHPYPKQSLIPGEPLFADLEEEVRDTLDVIASHTEGHDVSRRRLKQAELAVDHWNEMSKVLMPVVGLDFHPKLEVT